MTPDSLARTMDIRNGKSLMHYLASRHSTASMDDRKEIIHHMEALRSLLLNRATKGEIPSIRPIESFISLAANSTETVETVNNELIKTMTNSYNADLAHTNRYHDGSNAVEAKTSEKLILGADGYPALFESHREASEWALETINGGDEWSTVEVDGFIGLIWSK